MKFKLFMVMMISAVLTFAACGKIDVDHHVDGNISVTPNLIELNQYFVAECQAMTDPHAFCYNADVQACANCMQADFLNKVHF